MRRTFAKKSFQYAARLALPTQDQSVRSIAGMSTSPDNQTQGGPRACKISKELDRREGKQCGSQRVSILSKIPVTAKLVDLGTNAIEEQTLRRHPQGIICPTFSGTVP